MGREEGRGTPVNDAPGTLKGEARQLFAALPRHYDRVAATLSFGQDPRWRRAMVDTIAARPQERVLDVATGTGLVAAELVRRFGCKVTGIDQSAEMLGAARARLSEDRRLAEQVELLQAEAERLPFADGTFDHLTFTYLLRYVEDPAATLRELARVTRPGGRIASLEFGVPTSGLWRELWRAYTAVGLPALGRLLSREWAATGRFLAASIPAFYERNSVRDLLRMWGQAGIESVRVRPMSLGGGIVMWGTRASIATGTAAGHGRSEGTAASGPMRGESPRRSRSPAIGGDADGGPETA